MSVRTGKAAMNTPADEAALRRRVRAERGFYVHAIIYAAVIALLLLLNLMTGGGWWVQWPMLGWGIAVAINGITVFSQASLFGPAWEERRMRQLRDSTGETRDT
jgi:fatty acid desaturase